MTTTGDKRTGAPPDARPDETPAGPRAQQKADAKALREMLWPIAGALTVARLLAVVSALLAVVPYVALVHLGELLLTAAREGRAVDRGEVDRWVVVLLATFSLRLVVHFVALLVSHLADIRLGHLIRRRMVQRFARVPLVWFTSVNSGRVRKALQDDVTAVHHLIAHRPVDLTTALVLPLALTAYAFVVDWRLGLLAVSNLPLYAVAMSIPMRGMGEKTVQMDQKLGVVSARMVEFVTGITVVKAFGRVGRAHHAYRVAAEEFRDFYYDWVRPLITVSAMGSSLLAVPLILLVNLGVGAWLVRDGAVGVADVLTTSLIALLVPYGLEVLMSSMWASQLAGAAASRLTDLLETPVLPDSDDAVAPNGHDIVFAGISYSYDTGPDAELALDDVSFTLRAGTVTALVGPSGSGKSTIATLLARFDDPCAGRITLGGAPIDRLSRLYSHVGFVLQDPQLLSISIRDNITLGRPDATDDEVRRAARVARVLEEVEALPDGFDTVYGAGTGLSGGQAQRIAVARAVLADAPVLVLDEATALTDPESQHQIQQALSELVRGRTVLLIAHRPEAVKGVDQVVLVDRGRVVATGTHDELRHHPGYAQLWTSSTETLERGTPS